MTIKLTNQNIGIAILFLKLLLIIYLLIAIIPKISSSGFQWENTFLLYLGVGFLAQIIDGALGMLYGISCTTLLLHFGITPRVASAAVHTAEVFTTGVSGLSHIKFGNVDRPLFLRIVITGSLGAIAGAYLLSEVFDGGWIKPIIGGYLLILGIHVVIKGIRNNKPVFKRVKFAEGLALFGGFMDSIGGGGWGPIVTTNFLHQGNNPRETIGTVNTAEFFVTFFSSGVFMIFVGIENWSILLGLICGGILAAPIGAWIASRTNRKVLMILIGTLISITSFFTLLNAL